MEKREYLDLSVNRTLTLRGQGKTPREFTIQKVIGEGASCISYEALRGTEEKVKGILKEYYPKTGGLKRNKKGQLICQEKNELRKKQFEEQKKNFRTPYDRLRQEKNKEDGKFLSFIQSVHTYTGDIPKNAEGTVYIWTEDAELKTFETLCREFWEHPENDAKKKLSDILTAIKALTGNVRTLHTKNFIIRDIKPENFGFKEQEGGVLLDHPILFDLDALCMAEGSQSCPLMGTEAYMEPEAFEGEVASSQTDIYSIGATLGRAVLGKNLSPIKDCMAAVKRSKLLNALKLGNGDQVKKQLAKILEGCLSRREKRYENCEELLEALELVISAVNQEEKEKREAKAVQAIQYSLYRHPLYERMGEGEKAFRVQLLGFGWYAQKFLDTCLQVGQVWDKKLEVKVAFRAEAEKKEYLDKRPGLKEFFRIEEDPDRAEAGTAFPEEPYGVIRFEKWDFRSGVEARKNTKNRTALGDIILSGVSAGEGESWFPQYVFIDLGGDRDNLSMARDIQTIREDTPELHCIAAFAWEGETDGEAEREEKEAGLYRVYVKGQKVDPIHKDMKRMAINAHLTWRKSLQMGKDVRKEVERPYYYNASVGGVLSIQYKLHSMGIELGDNFSQAAAEYAEKVGLGKKSSEMEKTEKRLRQNLTWAEHRRWVTEKLCGGWRQKKLEDFNGRCPGEEELRDKDKKEHICIVHSVPQPQYLKVHPDKWNAEERNTGMDDLDWLSISLHKLFKAEAEKKIGKELLSGEQMRELREGVEGDRRAMAALQEWYSCMNDILKGALTQETSPAWRAAQKRAALYKDLKNTFLATEAVRKKKLETAVENLHKDFYPVLAAVERVDWKQNDVDQIKNIPFILTYTTQIWQVVPYVTSEDDSELFQNVAAATVLDPARIFYVYRLKKESDIAALKDSLPRVMNHMARKQLRAAVELILFYPDSEAGKRLKDLTEDWIAKEKRSGEETSQWAKNTLTCAGLSLKETKELPGKLEKYLARKNSRGANQYLVEQNETPVSERLEDSRILSEGFYEFDCVKNEFEERNCPILRYVKYAENHSAFVTVEDMTEFDGCEMIQGEHPDFGMFYNKEYDYERLWNIYSSDTQAWKDLCVLLGAYGGKERISFEKPAEDKGERIKYRYLLPNSYVKGAKKIVEYLTREDAIDKGSHAFSYTFGECEVVIIDKSAKKNKAKYDAIFRTNRNMLLFPEAILLKKEKKEEETETLQIIFDELDVKDLALLSPRDKNLKEEEQEKAAKNREELLEKLCSAQYIFDLEIDANGHKASFTYASWSIKELLGMSGRMLEVYVYHKLKANGEFDDVVSGYKVNWGAGKKNITNEYDCIATKGFRSVFIECKARKDVDQNFYYKLKALASGINPIIALVVDVDEAEDFGSKNKRTISRGRELEIHTIYKKEELQNFGDTLLKIMDGTYYKTEAEQ